MTRRVSVNMSVGDRLFDEIVMPAKDEKRLGRLVVSLLNAYQDDEYVRGLIDGDLDEYNNEQRNQLIEKLQGLQDTAREGGFHIAGAQASVQEGTSTFTEGFESQPEPSKKEDTSRMDRLEGSVSNLAEMLEKLIGTAASGSFAPSAEFAPSEDRVSPTLEPEPEVRVSPTLEPESEEVELSSEPVQVAVSAPSPELEDDDDFGSYDDSADFDDSDDDEEDDDNSPTDLLARLGRGVVQSGH